MRVVEAWEKSWLFLREVRAESRKVTWPSRRDTVASTAAVLAVVFLIALFLGVVDLGLSRFVTGLLRQ